MLDVAIIGGGISGLSLAWELRRRQVRAVVFEKDDRAGGKIRSERVDGFLCEWGPAAFSSSAPGVAQLMDALELKPRLVRARGARRRGVLLGSGPVEPVPESLSGLLASRLLSPREKLRILKDRFYPPSASRAEGDESLDAFGRRHLGAAGAARLLWPSLPGAYALDPFQTSVGAAFPWLTEIETSEGSLVRSAGALFRRADAGLSSFEGGMEELPRALAERLGDGLRVSSSLRAVAHRERGFRLQIERRGASEELDARAVVLATPTPAASQAVRSFDAALANTLSAIPYAPVTLAFLGFPLADPGRLDGHGFYVPPGQPSGLAGAIYASSMFPGRAPAGHALVTVRMGGALRPERAHLPDGESVDLAWKEIAALAGAQGSPSVSRLVRHPEALPQYLMGHRDRIAAVEAGERRHPGLFFAGNAYRGLGVADCLRQSSLLAERVTSFAMAEAKPQRADASAEFTFGSRAAKVGPSQAG